MLDGVPFRSVAGSSLYSFPLSCVFWFVLLPRDFFYFLERERICLTGATWNTGESRVEDNVAHPTIFLSFIVFGIGMCVCVCVDIWAGVIGISFMLGF